LKAIWNDKIIAESNETIVIEGNHYFPVDSVKTEFLEDSNTHTTCHWKGTASYYTINVEGKSNLDAAWFYPTPSDAAMPIKDRVAFWPGVQIKD
jgi:uncharacterized protein (DUF427 family)